MAAVLLESTRHKHGKAETQLLGVSHVCFISIPSFSQLLSHQNLERRYCAAFLCSSPHQFAAAIIRHPYGYHSINIYIQIVLTYRSLTTKHDGNTPQYQTLSYPVTPTPGSIAEPLVWIGHPNGYDHATGKVYADAAYDTSWWVDCHCHEYCRMHPLSSLTRRLRHHRRRFISCLLSLTSCYLLLSPDHCILFISLVVVLHFDLFLLLSCSSAF